MFKHFGKTTVKFFSHERWPLSKEEPMKKNILILWLIFVFSLPLCVYGLGLELAVGGWQQTPEGDLSYDAIDIDDTIDLEQDLNYEEKNRISGRLKIFLPVIPNIYLMATPMEFDETGIKSVDFTFGDQSFRADIDFESKLTLNHIDVALLYALPFIPTATNEILNIELGLNARIIDFKVEIKQPETGLEESEEYTVPIPMAYLAAQIRPTERIALEAETRGLTYSSNYIYSLIGRLKLKIFGPLFIAGGYRYDKIEIDEEDVEVDVCISGVFVETGLQF